MSQRTAMLAKLSIAVIGDLRCPLPGLTADNVPLDLETLHSDAKASAWAWISDEDGRVRPTLRMYRETGQIVELMYPTVPEDDIAFAAAMSLVVRKGEVDGYFVTSEVWLAEPHRDAAVNALMPVERSDRTEALVVMAATRAASSLKLYPILRGADGRCTGFDPALSVRTLKFDEPMLVNLYELGNAE